MSVTDEMVCFSLYSASRATTQAYRTLLSPWQLTYPQYLALVILWHEGDQSIGSLGEAMQLDSGTLSPLMRRLEQAGFVERQRSASDERIVTIKLTEKGIALRSELSHIPARIAELAGISSPAEAKLLIRALQALSASMRSA